jgi:hypothetical protein
VGAVETDGSGETPEAEEAPEAQPELEPEVVVEGAAEVAPDEN